MFSIQLALWAVVFVNASLAVAVGLTLSHRVQNRQFCWFSGIIALWALLVLGIINAPGAHAAAWLIRIASIAGLALTVAYHHICEAIILPDHRSAQRWRRTAWSWIPAIPLGALCLTRLFLQTVEMPGPNNPLPVPRADYGFGFYVYIHYFPIVFGGVILSYFRRLRQLPGVRRVELQFTVLGAAMAVPVAILIHLLAVIFGNANQQYGPLSIIPMNLMIAYGIATRRILGVAEVMRRALAYSVLGVAMLLLFGAVQVAARTALRPFADAPPALPYLLAALTVTFASVAAHGGVRRLADNLFIGRGDLDAAGAMQQAGKILRTLGTLDDLAERFTALIRRATDATEVALYLPQDGGFTEHGGGGARRFANDDPAAQFLRAEREPLAADMLERWRQTPLLLAARRSLADHRAQLLLGIYGHDELCGILRLGARHSGRFYGKTEQDILQGLCGQLAVALENARLFTDLRNQQRYTEDLLASLTTGVIATDAAGRVTVLNREARRLLPPGDYPGAPLERLPLPLAQPLAEALRDGRETRDRDAELTGPDGPRPVRLGAGRLYGHDRRLAGALLVFNDLSALKRLEEQVRRTDRLASVGTLAAGMAHEIKNPLVTVKTFAQLLPQRYDDAEFRERFAELLGDEVARIDGLVNQLLTFARPVKPNLAPMRLHELLHKTLRLIHEPLRQKTARLDLALDAPRDDILGDAGLLVQAFLNFLLNAVEALPQNGRVRVRTAGVTLAGPTRDARGELVRRPGIEVTLSDNGHGIAADDLPKIFDPFFTTKSNGTGLGLSVAHGILTEHDCLIEADSAPDRGTVFKISFPLRTVENDVP